MHAVKSHIEKVLKLTPDQLDRGRELAKVSVAYYQKVRHPGYKKFDMSDPVEAQKAHNQMAVGIFSEMAVREHLNSMGILLHANVDDQLAGFNAKLDRKPDFEIEWPKDSGKRRVLEVKANQCIWNDRFFRMIIPKHWWNYAIANAMVLWTSVDIELGVVLLHGFNYAREDMTVKNIRFIRTSVPNFQLQPSVALRQFSDEESDACKACKAWSIDDEVDCDWETCSQPSVGKQENGEVEWFVEIGKSRRKRLTIKPSTV